MHSQPGELDAGGVALLAGEKGMGSERAQRDIAAATPQRHRDTAHMEARRPLLGDYRWEAGGPLGVGGGQGVREEPGDYGSCAERKTPCDLAGRPTKGGYLWHFRSP